jgi:hypothetical protein
VVVRRVRLRFAPGLEVEFTDRGRGIRQVYELAERGTRAPVVVYGPEGCGKTAWLRQASEVLREEGYDVIYINVLQREYATYTDIGEVVEMLSEAVADITGYTAIKLADLAVLLASQLLKRWRRKRVALLVDELFQAIGLDRAETYTKALLNIIEYPPEPYESIVVVVTTSEGLSRWRVGRHRWADLRPMWNMPRGGFEELYGRVPGPKPPLEDSWRLTGGNPYAFSQLLESSWRVDRVVSTLVDGRGLTPGFVSRWRGWLELAVEDPDSLWGPEVPEELVNELVSRNLIVYSLRSRDPELWVDEPPPERDPDIGIGRYVAWQTPLHREAVRRALGGRRS